MIESLSPFHEFERRGWGDPGVAAAYHDRLGALTSQSIEPLLDAAGVGEGTRVLDVACGPGYVAAAASKRGAWAIGLDFSEAQLALARRLHLEVEFREGDAMALPFPDRSLDAVVSNYGMPHFPDPDAFLLEASRVLVSGGRVAFATWAGPQEAVGFGIVRRAVAEHGSSTGQVPAAPDFFRFADPAESVRSLEVAGFTRASCSLVPQTWRLSSPDELLDSLSRGTVRTAALLRGQTPEALELIRASAREATARFGRRGRFEVPMAAVVAAAEKR